jgi:hypothetical protein
MKLTKLLISILFLCCGFINAPGQTSLVGNWRRVNPTLNVQDTNNRQLRWGDIEIRADSTFHNEGDTSTRNSTIPDWHSGDEYNGTWQLHDNNRLTLWIEPKESKMFLWFIIVKVTKDKLVLRSGFNKNEKNRDIEYLRL